MKTSIIGGHVVDTPARELTDERANRVTADLAAQGIRVELVIDVYHVVHIWALAVMATAEEVTALAAVGAVTDCRMAWHGAVA